LFDYYITIPLFTNSGRYNDFAKELNANGFKVYGMDWIGKFEILHGCLDFSFLMRQNNLSVLAWYHYLAYW
jgi:acylglycerol lipase